MDFALQLVGVMSGLFVMSAPFFMLPFLIRRVGGNGIDKIAGNLTSKARGLNRQGRKTGMKYGVKESQLGRGVSSALSHRRQRRAINQTKGLAEDTGTNRLLSKLGGEGYAEKAANQAADLEEKEDKEAVAAVTSTWNSTGSLYDSDHLKTMALTGTKHEKRAALERLAATGSAKELREIQEDPRVDRAAFNKAVQTNYGALKAADPRIVDPGGGFNPDDISQQAMHGMKDYALKDMAGDPTRGQLTPEQTKFRAGLEAALKDPLQEQHFSQAVYDHMGVARPSAAGSATNGPTLIIPPSSRRPSNTTNPTPTQQQRQQGGNFNGP